LSTSFFLIRHAAYDYRPSSSGDAASDFGLSEQGLLQVAALRSRLERSGEIKPDAHFCSTLPRARQTAEMLAPVFGLAPSAMPELCEWESGNDALGEEAFMSQWQRLSAQECTAHRFYPGCETIGEFTHRVQTKLAELAQTYEGKTLALVVHGGVVEAAFAYFLGHGIGPYQGGYPAAEHTSITLWRRSERRGEWVQEYANDAHHLRSVA